MDHRFTRVMGLSGGAIFAVILGAGLWPFHAPKNHVEWLKERNGLAFYGSGIALSQGAFQRGDSDAGESISVWLEPWLHDGGRTILSFNDSIRPYTRFALRQEGNALTVRRRETAADGSPFSDVIVIENVLHPGQPIFISVTLGERNTNVYVNGTLVKPSPTAGTAPKSLTGQLLLADSATGHSIWPGKLFGLAIYKRELTAPQVLRSYQNWTKNPGSISQGTDLTALYRFNEGQGSLAHNEVNPATSLSIPRRYFILYPKLLATPQDEYEATWDYWHDILVNIAGFVPLGLWGIVYLSSVRPVAHPAALTVLIGFVTSLTIEVSQAFLPTRHSGMTDLITNTLGTVIGIYMVRWHMVADGIRRMKERFEAFSEITEARKEMAAVSE